MLAVTVDAVAPRMVTVVLIEEPDWNAVSMSKVALAELPLGLDSVYQSLNPDRVTDESLVKRTAASEPVVVNGDGAEEPQSSRDDVLRDELTRDES